NDIVHHPKFGVGFTSESIDDDKVEITFKDSRRVLVPNRKELPGAPPELARPPRPRPMPKVEKGGKKAKGKLGKLEKEKEAARLPATQQAKSKGKEKLAAKPLPKPIKGKAAAVVARPPVPQAKQAKVQAKAGGQKARPAARNARSAAKPARP